MVLNSAFAVMSQGRASGDNRSEAIAIYRPHTLLLRDWWIYDSLASKLSATRFDLANRASLELWYRGWALIDGHPCVELQAEISNKNQGLQLLLSLFLATDRNYIPIRLEQYPQTFGPLMPSQVTTCDDIREIAPGLWHPFRVTTFRFDDQVALAQGWMVLNSRLERTMQSVVSPSTADKSIFRDVSIPDGMTVLVRDKDGKNVGKFDKRSHNLKAMMMVDDPSQD